MPGSQKRASACVEQDERVRRITELAGRLLRDLAQSGYCERPSLDYFTPPCAVEVRRSLDAIVSDGNVVEADYGERVQGTAYLPDTEQPVQVELLVDDRSVLRAPTGARTPLPFARWLLEMELDSGCTQITSLVVSAA